MLIKIEDHEIKTIKEFREQYSNKWFRYVIVEKDDDWEYKQLQEIEVVVFYLADSKTELIKIPKEDLVFGDFYSSGVEWGINVNPESGFHIGGYDVVWSNSSGRVSY